MFKRLAAAAAALVMSVTLIVAPAAEAKRLPLPGGNSIVHSGAGERLFLQLVNRARSARHLRPVAGADLVAADARRFARQLALPIHGQSLWHDSSFSSKVGSRCSATRRRSENVAFTVELGAEWRAQAGRRAARAMFRRYMGSAGHRANILDPAADYLGVAVMLRRSGSGIYSTSVMRFADARRCR